MEAEPRQNHPDARLVPRMWWPKPGRYRTSGNKNELPWYSRASVPGPNSRRYWHELEEAHNSVIASTYLAISPLLHVSRSVSPGRPFTGSLQRALLVYMSRVDIHGTPVISGDMIDYHVLRIWLTSYRAPHIVRTSNGSWCMGIRGEMSDTVCVTFTWDMYIYELFIAFVCFVVVAGLRSIQFRNWNCSTIPIPIPELAFALKLVELKMELELKTGIEFFANATTAFTS